MLASEENGSTSSLKTPHMKPRINADKPHLWKADIAASVDQFNQWFMHFAPKAFRSTRIQTTEHVKAALATTDDLRSIDAATLKASPNALSTLRMCTAPPLAVDRLIGLAGANKNLVGRMEEEKIPSRMSETDLNAELTKLCRVISKLLDRDIFPWLGAGKTPTNAERERASTIVADRLCSAVATDCMSLKSKTQQLADLSHYLDCRGYREIMNCGSIHYMVSEPGTYMFLVRIPLAMGTDALIWVDALIQPFNPRPDRLPIIIQTESPRSFSQAMRYRAVQQKKLRQLCMTYGDDVPFILMLGGFCGAGYLGSQAAESLDWVWQHRLSDLLALGL